MNEPTAAEAKRAAAEIRTQLRLTASPAVALVLGSGLGSVTDRWDARVELSYASVPGLAPATTAGHDGRVVAGSVRGRNAVAFCGRLHLYEGHTAAAAGFIARIAAALGTPVLLVANAAGGIRDELAPGGLMIIDDHVNLSWRNPLVGPVVHGDQRFPDMLDAYDRELCTQLERAGARVGGSPLPRGVYAGVLGPSYETPAEIRMFARLGAAAVGMSTVPEVLVARACGMRVAGISAITNRAAGTSASRLSHDEVVRVASNAATRLAAIVEEFVASL